jgi:hypothetical protein
MAAADLDGGTWFLVLSICGIACWVIRNHLANIAMLLVIFPLMVLLSLAVNYGVVLAEVYPATKLAEWLVWTIIGTSVGSVGGITTFIALSNLLSRSEAAR